MPTLFSTRYGFHRRFNADITELRSNGAASPAAAAPKVDGTCWSGFQTETSQSATRACGGGHDLSDAHRSGQGRRNTPGPVAAQPKSLVGFGYRGNPGGLIFDHDSKVRRRQRIGKHRRDSLDDLDCSTVRPAQQPRAFAAESARVAQADAEHRTGAPCGPSWMHLALLVGCVAGSCSRCLGCTRSLRSFIRSRKSWYGCDPQSNAEPVSMRLAIRYFSSTTPASPRVR